MVHETAAKSSHRQNEITSDNGMKTLDRNVNNYINAATWIFLRESNNHHLVMWTIEEKYF